MALVSDLTKTVTEATPVYAAVGITDLAVEKIRNARERAVAVRSELKVDALQKKAGHAVEQAQQVPAHALNRTLVVAGKAQESYEDLARRGEQLVSRIRNQKATKDLVAQAENAVAQGKGAVTTVRNAAGDTQRAAKATLTTGRRESEQVLDAVSASAKTEGKAAGKATRTSAKRTSTTATKRAANAKRATKSAATSTRKTATRAKRATTSAAAKVGD